MAARARKLTRDQIDWFRLRRSGLVEPFASPEEAARSLLGIQAQMPSAAGIALWNRTASFRASDLDAARVKRRKLVRFWGQRNTIHLYATDDWPFLHTAFCEIKALLDGRLEKAGLLADFRKLIRKTERRLRERGSLTYKDVTSKKLLQQKSWAVAYVVFMQLVREGLVCHGPDEGSESTFVLREDWRPKLRWKPPAPEQAFPELARRYLAAYGPATDRDLAFWYGAGLGKARAWIAEAGAALAQAEHAGTPHWFPAADADELFQKPPPRSKWPVRLLHRFDPLLLATKDKTWLVDDEHYKEVWRPSAHVDAVILVRGRIAGTWRYDRKSKGLAVQLRPFQPLARTALSRAKTQAKGVAAHLDMPLLDVTTS